MVVTNSTMSTKTKFTLSNYYIQPNKNIRPQNSVMHRWTSFSILQNELLEDVFHFGKSQFRTNIAYSLVTKTQKIFKKEHCQPNKTSYTWFLVCRKAYYFILKGCHEQFKNCIDGSQSIVILQNWRNFSYSWRFIDKGLLPTGLPHLVLPPNYQ